MRLVILAFLLALVGPAAAVLLQPFFFASGDGPFHLFRLVEYESLWRQGILYPRWAPDFYFGYGYPVFNYYAPLAYYAALPFLWLRADPILATKLVVLLSLVLSGAGAYLYACLFLSRPAAAVCAAAFTYAPYHLVTLYYRGDLAESLALAWYPMILWSVTRVLQTRRPGYALSLVLSLGGLVLSHNLSALLFAPVLVCYVLAWVVTGQRNAPLGLSLSRSQKGEGEGEGSAPDADGPPTGANEEGSIRSRQGIFVGANLRDGGTGTLTLALSLLRKGEGIVRLKGCAMARSVAAVIGCAAAAAGLTAFFWLPAVAETSLISMQRLVEKLDYHAHFVGLTDLISLSRLQPYGSIFNTDDALNHQMALWQSLLLVFGVLALVLRWRSLARRLRVESVFQLSIAGMALFLVLPASTWLWERVAVLALVQFPWRFLGFAALPVAVLGALAVESAPRRWRSAIASVAIFVILAASMLLLRPTQVSSRTNELGPDDILRYELVYGVIGTSIAGEYLPSAVTNPPVSSPLALARLLGREVPAVRATSNPTTRVAVESRGAYDRIYRISAPAQTTLTLNLLYFPGWQARLDGHPLSLVAEKREGLAQVTVPAGQHELAVVFGETPLRLAADIVSLLFGLGLVGGLSWRGLKTRDAHGRGVAHTRLRWERPPKAGASARAGETPALPGGLSLFHNVHRRSEVVTPRPGLSSSAIWLTGAALLLVATAGLKITHDRYYAVPSDVPDPTLVKFPSATLLGYAVESNGTQLTAHSEPVVGGPLSVRLFWQTDVAAVASRAFTRLTGRDQQTWAYAESSLSEGQPAEGSPIDVRLDLRSDSPLPSGVYRLEAGLISGGSPAPIQSASVVDLLPTVQAAQIGPLVIGEDRSLRTATLVTDGQLANLEGTLFLKKADVAAARAPWEPASTVANQISVRAGEEIHIDALWQLSRGLPDDYTMTFRLADDQGLLWAVKDILPSDRSYPISLWPAQTPVADKLNMSVPSDTPPGVYRLQLEVVGSDHPLSVLGPDDIPMGPTVLLGQIQVEPANLTGQTTSSTIAGSQSPEQDLVLLGKRLGSIEAQPGDRLHVDLRWLARKSQNRDLDLRLILEDADHRPSFDETVPLVSQYPTSRWRAGEIVRGQYLLNLSARTPVGSATLRAQVVAHDSHQVLLEEILGIVRIKDRPRVFQASPQVPRAETLGNRVRLIGYDLPSSGVGTTDVASPSGRAKVAAGVPLSVALYWQAIQEMNTSYKVFVQLLDPSGRLVAQHDSQPRDGQLPTTGWQIGEVVTDTHRVELPATLPPEKYAVIVGLYDPASGARLTLPIGTDFVRLLEVDVTGGTR